MTTLGRPPVDCRTLEQYDPLAKAVNVAGIVVSIASDVHTKNTTTVGKLAGADSLCITANHFNVQ